MSYKLQDAVWEIDLKPPQKLTLKAMAKFADVNGVGIFPATESIACLTGYTARHTRRIIKELVDLDLLIFRGIRNKCNDYDINMVRFNAMKAEKKVQDCIDKADILSTDILSPLEEKEDTNPDILSPKAGHLVTLTPDILSANPDILSPKAVKNQSLESVKESNTKKIASDDADTDSKNSDSTPDKIIPFEDMTQHQKIVACIKAWKDGQKSPQGLTKNEYGNKTNRNIMAALLEKGVTPDDITRFMAVKAKLDWYVSITALNNSLLGWLSTNPRPPEPEPEPVYAVLTQADHDFLDAHNAEMQGYYDIMIARMAR